MIDLVLLAIFAIVIGSKLFEALGRKDHDKDNFGKDRKSESKNVIRFPDPKSSQNKKLPKPDLSFINKNLYEEKYGKETAERITKIKSLDNNFSPEEFLSGASIAFEMVIKAFAEEDKSTLKQMLSEDVYKNFASSIDERQAANHKLSTTIISISPIDLQEISLKRRNVSITVLIKSEQVNCTKDKEDNIVKGDNLKSEESLDVWTFARNLSSQNPNWELIETR